MGRSLKGVYTLKVFEITAYDEKEARKELGKLIEKGVLKDIGRKEV